MELVCERHICVAVVTRNRPKMLAELIATLSSMAAPQDVKVSFLVVENNNDFSLANVISKFRTMMPQNEVGYLLEPTIGISAARNRALDYSLARGCDFLVFVDDDETVEQCWLMELLAVRDRHELDMVGSPVRPRPYQTDLSWMQSLVWSGIEKAARKSEDKCRRKCERQRADTIKIATGSWMGRVEFFRRTGLRFDMSLGLTGGEDWNLWSQAKSLDARTGWAPDAIVYESVPSSRLTLSYHFRRTRDHNITEFIKLNRKDPAKARRKLVLKLVGRAVRLVGSVCSIPFRGAHGLVSSATALGGFLGLVQAGFGKRSCHYSNTTGV
ncbi:glycosyltransferase family 2 protein [Brucella pseudogrignonensis]|uniref:glycosyltransferase family 2 protein n=1 Tax=Brucella pseudogrignonensis TaxID=419475 RepID=UPI0038CFFA59